MIGNIPPIIEEWAKLCAGSMKDPKANDLWYTPECVLKPVREFLGEDYFDPCPIDPTFDGIAPEAVWQSNCFINPPYSRDLKRAFIKKGLQQVKTDSRFLWLVNYACSEDLLMLKENATAILLPDKRISFIPGHPELKAGSPRYDNIFILWGDPTGFEEAFSEVGLVFK